MQCVATGSAEGSLAARDRLAAVSVTDLDGFTV